MSNLLKKVNWMTLLIPVISVILGLLCGAVIMLVIGYNPVLAYQSIVESIFLQPYYGGETIRAMIPLVLAGLAVAFSFRTGLFNIGVEGQLMVGWLASVACAISLGHLPKILLLPLSIVAGGAAGALWGFIPGFLKARFKVHEVISTIMMNYIALYTTAYLIKNFLYTEGERTPTIPSAASLASPFLANLTQGSRLHWGIIVAIIAVFAMWFLLWKTTKGYELRSVGFSPDASNYAGMSVARNIMLSLTISGIFAGLAGAMEGLGTYQYMTISSAFTGIGFNGIAVALLGLNTPIGVLLAGALFSGLQNGGLTMQANAGVPVELVNIIIALIIFFVGSSYAIKWALSRFSRKGKK
ncbi:ABC transporter permease [Sporolactobacillus inulinus]|uniref:Branched-chain amino acid ABC transporter permease n=2 Tax=Sporolactobacillus inulinus TaxID=2078 RepID=A0A0U1QS03_9BACL|nr:ABC transporter permease [Sporolactobacillus inulinus]KLI03563.1 branched-chain amino acid ABC transporter permease [Sporolactobacillus inulinus CASD]GEB76996.1 ABC transporter permease [Sporolactobacillus inulinus]